MFLFKKPIADHFLLLTSLTQVFHSCVYTKICVFVTLCVCVFQTEEEVIMEELVTGEPDVEVSPYVHPV